MNAGNRGPTAYTAPVSASRRSVSVEDRPFADVLRAARCNPDDDDELAGQIERDGRQRIIRGRPVTLERYLDAVSDLLKRSDPLDAAIDVTLRWMCRSARADPTSVDELVARYPALEQAIREAAVLNNAMWSTTGLRSKINAAPDRPLPSEFGPRMPDGRYRYELRRILGSGAFGQVYEGIDRQLSEDSGGGYEALVAVKILAPTGRTELSRHRLTEEATKARRIDHPNVVRVLDRGISGDDKDFIVYELVEGGDLSHWFHQQQIPIEPRRIAELMAKIARGIQAAHAAGLVHCDLKPGNIMLTAQGEPKVADFGIAIRAGESLAELRAEGIGNYPIGNLAFISPEQYRMEDSSLTAPSDIFALGGMLYLLLTGEMPNGASVQEIAQNHHPERGRTEPPSPRARRSTIDADLDAICRRAMATRPEDRYSSAGAMADDLEAWLRFEPLLWTKPSAWRIGRLWAKRRPAMAAVTGLLIGSIVLGSAATHVMHRRANIMHQLAVEAEAQREIEAIRREEQEQRSSAMTNTLMKRLERFREVQAGERYAPQIFTALWAIRFMLHPEELTRAETAPQLWTVRFRMVRGIVREAVEQGRGGEVETLLWKTVLAFWHIEQNDFAAARDLLDGVRERWEHRLDPDDRWLSYIQAMMQAADVLEHAETFARADDGPDEITQQQLERLGAALREHADTLESYVIGSPLHMLVLRALHTLHGPDLFDQPMLHDELASRMAEARHMSLVMSGSPEYAQDDD